MNRLAYGLLSLLSTNPMTGYDLTIKINKFWQSTHSAIYPLLSELEEEGCVEPELVKQSDKPDKKVYSLTQRGRDMLREWFISEASQPVIRDEMSLKLCCMQVMEEELVEQFLQELENRYQLRIETCGKGLQMLREKAEDNKEEIYSQSFGTYLLTQRILSEAELDLAWCTWARNAYKNKEFSEFHFS